MTEQKVIPREILAQDSFAQDQNSIQARMEQMERLGLEYIHETTGQRRVHDPERLISHNEAFQIAAEHRQAGEVFLQVKHLETRNTNQEERPESAGREPETVSVHADAE
ncbi:hypothetical protein Dxin01_00124 [Deinococcus xinjiangensis]|uniref:Uncharacterized protein n=1 Tax=Deinococcus xinjiangensis TaxID=457454 RepID=A0ABP9V8U0_9DEIO